MPDPTYAHAGFTLDADTVTTRFAVTLDNPVHEVWAALTDSARLAQWLAPGSIELAAGGRARLDFVDSGIVIDSPVISVEPEHRLEYSWSGPGEPLRPLLWTLEPMGPLTLLALTLTLPRTDDVARSAAGWAAHLEMLQALLAGAQMRFPFPVFQAARAGYGAQLAWLIGQAGEAAAA